MNLHVPFLLFATEIKSIIHSMETFVFRPSQSSFHLYFLQYELM